MFRDNKRVVVHFLFAVVVVMLITACSASKFIPDNRYMLDKVVMKSDRPGFDAAQLAPYIRQKSNSRWFSLFKIPLGTYSLSGKDTTKWINRTLQRIGEQPVLFDSAQARLSCEDLRTAMQNMGYMNASVGFEVKKKRKRRIDAVYTLHPGDPFLIRHFSYDIQDSGVERVLRPFITKNFAPRQFTVADLDKERTRLTAILNDSGYYHFHKDFIQFSADSARGSHDVDVTLHLMKYRKTSDDSAVSHPRYRIGAVRFVAGDSTGLHLRRSVLANSSAISEGSYFSSSALKRTYNNFGRLGAVRYTNIDFAEHPDSNLLDCNIQIFNQKPNTISFQPEGTNTSGDFGAAASLTYQNRNIFRGSELFSLQLRAAFEAISKLDGYDAHDYEEYSVTGSLQFPRFVAPFLSDRLRYRSTATSEIAVSWDLQNRPEFHRRVFSSAWKYRWSDHKHDINYNLDLLDLNYVYMPWISPTFKHDYLDSVSNRNAILRYNYEDLFIMKVGFGLSYSNARNALRANIETAGNILRLLSKPLSFSRDAQGHYQLFNIAYAEYMKFDFDYTHHIPLAPETQLVLHTDFGIAWPYGNSSVLPFEKRYFAGGANSVRGWSVRELGPGTFRGHDGRIDFINQTGDMKLDLNAEMRSHLFWKFDGAAFIDAGNIWTLRAYADQPGGQFKFKDFYKQIALAYGLGLRLNFDYFILRFDMGMKAINPAYENNKEHYAIIHPDLGRDFTFHFAVGLPF